MSYIVTFTKNNIPSDDHQAWKYLEELMEKEDETEEQSAEFLDLIEQLKLKFPCICDLVDDQADDGVWSDGPLSNNAGNQLATIGMVGSSVELVMPFLIECAQANKMVLFDHQTDMIFRPEKIEFRKFITDNQAGTIVSEESVTDKSQIRAKVVEVINNARDQLSRQKGTLILYCVCFASILPLAIGICIRLAQNNQFLMGAVVLAMSVWGVLYFIRLYKKTTENIKKSKEVIKLLTSKLR